MKSHDFSVHRNVTAWVAVERRGMENSFNSAVPEFPGCYWGLTGAWYGWGWSFLSGISEPWKTELHSCCWYFVASIHGIGKAGKDGKCGKKSDYHQVQPSTSTTSKPCPQVPHAHVVWALQGWSLHPCPGQPEPVCDREVVANIQPKPPWGSWRLFCLIQKILKPPCTLLSVCLESKKVMQHLGLRRSWFILVTNLLYSSWQMTGTTGWTESLNYHWLS